jgi:hypothetical protein
MADFNKPQVSDAYGDVLQAVRELLAECAKFQDGSSNTNVPTGAVRFSSTNKRFEKWNGSAWAELIAKASDKYDINVDRVDGYDAGNASGQIPVNNATLNTNLNADLLDGQHASAFALAPPNGQGGVRRLYRSDDGSAYNVQTYWTGTRWRLRGYNDDTFHAEAEVARADTAGTADNANALGGLGLGSLQWYQGWVNSPGYDANTLPGSRSGFSYANNAARTGPLVHFDAGGYGLQLSADYGGGGVGISYRTRNGDAAAWNGWHSFWHSGNFDPGSKANAATSLQKSGDTASDLYNNGWFRSIGQTGWYSQTYGGGIWMADSTWVRVYGSKGFLTDWHQLHSGGNIWTSSYGWLHDRFANANPNAEQAATRISGNCGNVMSRAGHEIFNAGGGVLQTRQYIVNCTNCNCNCTVNCNCGGRC